MLNHVSHAASGVDNNPSEKRSEVILFDENSTSATSPTFTVNKDPVYIGCFNLSPLDTFVVKMVTNVSPNEDYEDFCPVKGPVVLSETFNKFRLDMPGRYALTYTGSSNYTSTLVKAFPGEMTHETSVHTALALSQLAAALANQSNAVVQGDPPITVTGVGTPGDPYIVGANLANNVELETGSPGTQIVTNDVLRHILGVWGSPVVGPGPIHLGQVYVGTDTNVTGTDSVYVGWRAGYQATMVGNNVVIGSEASQRSIGDGVVVIGHRAGEWPVAGSGDNSNSIYIGKESGYYSRGQNTIAIGYQCNFATLNDNTIAIGTHALNTAFMGDNGIALGLNAINNQDEINGTYSVGQDTIAIGTNVINKPGANSIALGESTIAIGNGAFSSSTNPCSSSGNSIAIGKNAGDGEQFNNVIIIGSDATALNATQNNQIILGNSTQTQLVTAGSIIQGGVIGPSDKRLKKNVENYTSGLEAINKLRPVTFDWDENALKQANINILREDIQRKQHGLIAQELEEVFPTFMENVNRGFGDYKFIHNERLIPVMISAIKELSVKVDSLTKELNKKSTKKGVEDNV